MTKPVIRTLTDAKNALRRGWSLVNADCEGANLPGWAVEGTNLSGANFRDATLTGSYFARCQFTHADFTGANLTGATFKDVMFAGATFTDATLEDIDHNWTSSSLIAELLRRAAGDDSARLAFADMVDKEYQDLWDIIDSEGETRDWAVEVLTALGAPMD